MRMLNGLLETTENWQKCVLRGALPADSHHLHIISYYVSRQRTALPLSQMPISKTLTTHRMAVSLQTNRDADPSRRRGYVAFIYDYSRRFRFVSNKSVSKLRKRTKHKNSDFTNAIHGLLLQSEIQQAWQQPTSSLDLHRCVESKWNKLENEDLQR